MCIYFPPPFVFSLECQHTSHSYTFLTYDTMMQRPLEISKKQSAKFHLLVN